MTAAAVLVLSGSSGRVEHERVRLLTDHGAVALSIRWFGDVGQPPGICEVPLETFTPALDHLAGLSDHIVVLGTSKGAEAALLLAVRDPRIRTVVALSPTSVVWESVGSTGGPRSSWTSAGTPLPFVPYDPTWTGQGEPPAFRSLYEQSLTAFPEAVAAASIPVEQIRGRVLLSAGGDDRVWPSDRFAADIAARRAAHGLATISLGSAAAGHRVLFPGESAPAGGMRMARGGSAAADAELGGRMWAELCLALGLT